MHKIVSIAGTLCLNGKCSGGTWDYSFSLPGIPKGHNSMTATVSSNKGLYAITELGHYSFDASVSIERPQRPALLAFRYYSKNYNTKYILEDGKTNYLIYVVGFLTKHNDWLIFLNTDS